MKNKDIEFSVVIPTLGNILYLERAIKSVIQQTYPVYEIIVVADKYTDDTINYLDKLKKENKLIKKIIYNEVSLGGSEARNIGIRNSASEWIALLDDDDEWLPDKLKNQVELIELNKNAIFCTYFFRNNGLQMKEYPRNPYSSEIDIGYYLFGVKNGRGYGGIQTSSIVANKSVFQQFEFTNGLVKHQDWDWLLRVFYIGKIPIVQSREPSVIYHIPINNKDNVSKINRWKFSKKWIEQYKNYLSIKAYDGFLQTIVINGIIDDYQLSKKEKIKLIKEIEKKISIKSRYSLYNLRNKKKLFFKLVSKER